MNGLQRFSMPYFLFRVEPRRHDVPEQQSGNECDLTRRHQLLDPATIATKNLVVSLLESSSTCIGTNPSGQVILLLHGEIYDIRESQTDYLLRLYEKYGLAFGKHINGSFALLLIDRDENRVAIVTDRINSRKVFWCKLKGRYWFSNTLSLLPLAARAHLDVTGLASYLANGVVYGGRTVFNGINVLERASIHQITSDRIQATQYWSYEFGYDECEKDQGTFQHDLSDLLIDSVRKRLNEDEQVFLSLSGGFDATGIIGILSKLGVSGVRCFSYALGTPSAQSDAEVSRTMADLVGYEHTTLSSYNGDVIGVINKNVLLGHGSANFCDEVDAWGGLWRILGDTAQNCLFVGDECFGWTNCHLRCETDVLNVVSMFSFDTLAGLRRFFLPQIYGQLREALSEEYARILARCPSSEDYHDLKDFLYLDQRLNHVILPWREHFALPGAPVRNPYLDNNILDFMKTVPRYLRRGKRLYKNTVSTMFPDLFRLQRASAASYVPDWRQEIDCKMDTLETLVRSNQSRLDSIFPQQNIISLLAKTNMEKEITWELRMLAGRIGRRVLGGGNTGKELLYQLPTLSVKQTPPSILILRILVIRMFLQDLESAENSDRAF